MNETKLFRPMLLAAALLAAAIAGAQDSEPAKDRTPETPAAEAAAKDAEAALPARAEDTRPLEVGDTLPNIPPLKDADGNAVDLASLVSDKPVVLVFYRGGWCPYCTTQLSDLARIQGKLEEAGIGLVAISPESPASLRKTMEKETLPYRLLSDSEHHAMKAFRIAYAVDAETKKAYKDAGIDLAEISGNSKVALPMPSVFIIGTDKKITYAFWSPDYQMRLSGDEVLMAATGKKQAK